MTLPHPEPTAEPDWDWRDLVEEPDISHVVIEDDRPVDNIYSEKLMRLLTEPLYSSWVGPRATDGSPRTWIATADVGVFATPDDNPLVPDVLLSVDVSRPERGTREKKYNTYFNWVMGKPPDIVIEIVSNKKGGEFGKRKDGYARLRVTYYVVWDPEHLLSSRELSAFMLSGDEYLPMTQADFTHLGLALRPWVGRFEGSEDRWLRWFADGELIPTGKERADTEAARAQLEAARADKLAALLRAQGIDPDSL